MGQKNDRQTKSSTFKDNIDQASSSKKIGD
jgi:hypothetical protein